MKLLGGVSVRKQKKLRAEYEKTEYEKSRTCFKVALVVRPRATRMHILGRDLSTFAADYSFMNVQKRPSTDEKRDWNKWRSLAIAILGKKLRVTANAPFSRSVSPPPRSLSLLFTISNFFFYCLLFSYEEKAAHDHSRISTASLLSIVRLNRHFLNSEKVNDLGHESSHIHLQGFDCEIFQESRIAVLSLRNSGFRMESRV